MARIGSALVVLLLAFMTSGTAFAKGKSGGGGRTTSKSSSGKSSSSKKGGKAAVDKGKD